uniref:Reverse transcriptase domain-containing protein n=1 Tax=Trichobilharzia regenti TaxID=157069 RepID=A0AA85K253_TRIRE|nr:unnamed protein product [Trichobilharzia regenti]
MSHLGTTSKKQKDWISEHTMLLSSQARDARLAKSPVYRSLRRKATQSARNDRNRYWSNVATNMEAASNVGDFGKLYRLIRQSSGKRLNSHAVLRTASGEIISDTNGKMERWAEHFKQLLNRDAGQPSHRPIRHLPTPYVVDCDPPTPTEIAKTINRLRNKKAPGEDGLPPEIYKACTPALIDALHSLFCSIWESETIPSDWSTSVLLPFHKKGDRSICENYRGISLIDIAAKVFVSILLNRFAAERHVRTRPNQAGFRPGRGCVDQLFTLRRILEHRDKFQQPTVACFIDFQAAFDSVDRGALWYLMELDGVPTKLINLLRSYYSNTKARVRVNGEESRTFEVTSGVRQGCPASPILFNFTIDWILRHALTEHHGVQLSPDIHITDLEFADDVVLLAENFPDMQQALDQINHLAPTIGLKINTSKTKMFSNTSTSNDEILSLNGAPIEIVPSFRYLGSIMLPNGQAKNEVNARISNARNAFLQLRSVLWSKREISLRTKIRVYQASIRPVLLYGCETWPLRAEDLRRLEVVDHWCLRYILHVRWQDKLSNEEVRRRCYNINQIPVLVQQRRLRWFGHVLRRPDDDLVKSVLNPSPLPSWRCRRGGQLKTWLGTVKADMECLGLQTVYGLRLWNKNWITLSQNLASDRRAWAAMIRDVHEAGSSSRRR